ncbi:MAG: hypothetical protein J5971_07550 [Prevotella sp.]|nr:hypothetical protein [Prevotella sp.]
MKIIHIIVIVLIVMPLQMVAQNIQGMFYEGKRWNYVHRYIDKELEQYLESHPEEYVDIHKEETVSYTILGDTVIGGVQCYKMYYESPDTIYYERACYEKDSIIYFILAGTDNFKMFYDRKNHIGEDIFYDYSRSHKNVINEREYTFDLFDDTAGNHFVWIYPVGTFSYGILYNSYMFTGTEYTFFSSISDEQGTIVNRAELENIYENILSGVSFIQEDNKRNRHCLYDLAGRRLSTTRNLRPGIYVCSGKKITIK